MRTTYPPGSHRGILLSGLLLAAGCASDDSRRQLYAPTALERARAAVRVAESHDPAAIPALVNLLEDSDPAVRLFAIQALERLCGTTHGYTYHGSREARDVAVRRWRDSLRAGDVRLVQQPAPARFDRVSDATTNVAAPESAATDGSESTKPGRSGAQGRAQEAAP